MAEYELTYQVHIDAPRERVWSALADFGGVSRITPSVSASQLTSEGEVGVGSTRHCDLPMLGATTEERITDYDEGQALGVEIYGGKKLPVNDPHALFTVADDGDGTLLTLRSRFQPKGGPLGALMYRLAMRNRIDRGWRLFLAGVKHHVETGEAVERDTIVPVDQVQEAVAA